VLDAECDSAVDVTDGAVDGIVVDDSAVAVAATAAAVGDGHAMIAPVAAVGVT
jgi:hypothetical protein